MSLKKIIIGWLTWSGVFGLAFGGGGSSSSSSSTVQTSNTDKRQVVDGSSVGVSSDSSTVNVTATDHGTVKASIDLVGRVAGAQLDLAKSNTQAQVDLAKTNTEAQARNLGALLGYASEALKITKDNINLAVKNTDQIGSAWQAARDSSDGNRTLAIGGLVIAGIVAVIAFSKGR